MLHLYQDINCSTGLRQNGEGGLDEVSSGSHFSNASNLWMVCSGYLLSV